MTMPVPTKHSFQRASIITVILWAINLALGWYFQPRIGELYGPIAPLMSVKTAIAIPSTGLLLSGLMVYLIRLESFPSRPMTQLAVSVLLVLSIGSGVVYVAALFLQLTIGLRRLVGV